jgi:hypothetical protein
MTSRQEAPSHEKGEAWYRQYARDFSEPAGQREQARHNHDRDHQTSDRELGAMKAHGRSLMGWTCPRLL